ncbi:ABC transporter ATP-binding protein [Nucisporomicrobium flavum]|uniref:ABC transporter ATP-binding protein n=1 Tax=Nucisporomicrobium flavum TaxID=2785915 RepID=UPI001F45A831|nr:ABC transporter ATP-binding protein [Nucisporomicrobium flavum]
MTVLTVTAAGVRDRRRWLFQDLNVTASAGDIVAIVGPPGSGRTTVLLALAQRFRLSSGRVESSGTAALGHVPGVSEPESVLTVAEHVRERALLAGRRRAGDVALRGLDPELRGFALSPYQKQILGIVLAQMTQPQIVALDAVDEGLDAGERQALWALIDEMAAAGTTVLVTAREVDEARASTVIRLGEASGQEALNEPSYVDGHDAPQLATVPADAPPTGPEAEPDTNPEVELATEPEAELESEPEAEPEAELGIEPDAEPRFELAMESKAEPKVELAMEPKAEPKVEPDADTEAEREAGPEAERKAELEADPKAGPGAEPAIASPAEPVAVPKARVALADAPEPVPTTAAPTTAAPTAAAPTTAVLKASDPTKTAGETK